MTRVHLASGGEAPSGWHFRTFCLLVCALGFALQLPSNFIVHWDMSTYLSNAKFAWLGVTPAESDVFATSRGGYIGLLTLLYLLPGAYLVKVALMQAGFCALSALGFGVLAWRVYGRAAAWTAVCLWFSTVDLLHRLPAGIDPVWPPFILGALLLLWREPAREISWRVAIVAGALVGVALSIKEATAPFAALPVLLLAARVIAIRPVALLAWALALALSFWLIGALLPGAAAAAERGAAYDTGSGMLVDWLQREVAAAGGHGVGAYLAIACEALVAYFTKTARGPGLASAVPLLPVAALGLAWALWRAVALRDRAAAFLLCAFLLSLPLAAISGLMGLRVTQDLPVVGLAYIMTARLVLDLAARLDRSRRAAWLWSAAVVGMTLALVTVGVSRATLDPGKFVQGSAAWRAVTGARQPFEVTVPGQALAEWIASNVPAGSTVLVENVLLRYCVTYLLGADYQVRSAPLANVGYTVTWPYYPLLAPRPGEPLEFLALSSPVPGLFLNVLLGAQRGAFDAGVAAHGRPYVAIGEFSYGQPLIAWLAGAKGFERITRIKGRRAADRVTVLRPPASPPLPAAPRQVDSRVREHLRLLAARGPQAQFQWHAALVRALLDLGPDASIMDAAPCAVTVSDGGLLCY
ncbi:MAG: hypothetical protein AB7I01_05135 [Gammaproteobacteria bacterium]